MKRHAPHAARVLAAALAAAVLLAAPARADFDTAESLMEQRRYDEAFAELLPVAVAGNATAQLYLANMYRRGYGVKRSYKEAARWYRAAAEQGEPSAMYNYAVHLRDGVGVKRDSAEASDWFQRGAEAGHPPSMLNLGLRYFNGRGLERDEVLGYAWVYKAAGKANVQAIRRRNALEQQMGDDAIAAGRRRALDLP